MNPQDVHLLVCQSFDEFVKRENREKFSVLLASLLSNVREIDAGIAFDGLVSIFASEPSYVYQNLAGELLLMADIPCPLTLSDFMRRVLPLLDTSVAAIPRYAARVFGREAVLKQMRSLRVAGETWAARGAIDSVCYWLGDPP